MFDMNFSIKNMDDIIVVIIDSEINMENVGEFDRAMHDLVESGNTNIVFDMSRVNFLVSQGVGLVASILRATRASGGDLKLSNLNSRVAKLFEITRLSSVIEIYQTEAEAVASFRVNSD